MSSLAYRHQRVQRLRRLVGRRSARKDEGRFVIEGVNLLEEALSARVAIEAVYLDGDWARQGSARTSDAGADVDGWQTGGDCGTGARDRLSGLLDRCLELGARVFELEPGVLARVADTVTPQPVMAIVETPRFDLSDIGTGSPQLVVVCVDVRDPGNAGTVVRSGWASGADAVVFCEGSVDPWNPKAVRSSAGAVLHMPVLTAGPPPVVLREMGEWGMRRLGAVREGGCDYATLDLTLPTALCLRQRGRRSSHRASWPQYGRCGQHPDARRSGVPQRRHGCGRVVLRGGPPASLWATGAERKPRLGAAYTGAARMNALHAGVRTGKLAGK